jgi:type IV pilus assembly protein PilY1
MHYFIQKIKAIGYGLALSSAFLPAITQSAVSPYTMGTFTAYPTVVTENTVTPLVLLAMSKDHTLFSKAYNDFSDIDPENNDGIETTYKHAHEYYGYFDSYKCYSYLNNQFEPQATTANKYCDAVAGEWSGNFLNWAAMSRIDAIRKILYGGNRRTDTNATTVLERTYLPNDAHSWAKYYNGNDINKLTPFNPPTADADPKKNGITLCNTSVLSANRFSQDANNNEPPLIRTASGNWSLWAGNERWQCRWSEEKAASNGNNAAQSSINAYSSNPALATNKLGDGNYIARIKVCVSGLEESNCKQYPTSAHRQPTGLLQGYGDDNKLYFGVMGGSYGKNKSGGDLYKDIGSITDEVNVTTDGTFKTVSSLVKTGGTNDAQSAGVINAWSLFRIVGYDNNDGTYNTNAAGGGKCPWGLNTFNNGECMMWGNPFSEIYLNSLRYLAGEPPSGQFRTNGGPPLPGLPVPQNWNCPLTSTNACARLNIVAINSSAMSYDTDELDGASYGIQSIGAPSNSTALTNTVGAAEGIHGNNYFVGQSGASNDGLCTIKTVSALGDSSGICPEAPRLGGSHRVAGLAHWAHTNDIRASGAQALDGTQSVDTYAVTLSPGAPVIMIPVPGSDKEIAIVPACRNSSINGNCAIVDFKIVQAHAADAMNPGHYTGKFYVNWEDSEQGGDFDQDMWGTINYDITSTTIAVTTDVHAESTGYKMAFGYVIAGTTKDGFHAYSGIEAYVTGNDDNTGVTECNPCNVGDAAVSYTFNIGTSGAELLPDPLLLAAKWGGFDDENGNKIPDLQTEWDRYDTDGQANPDGLPDNYFYVTDPKALEEALIRVFDSILAKTGSGTAAAVVAGSRNGTGATYQALYETQKQDTSRRTAKWFGNLHSLWIDKYGYIREDGNSNRVLDDYNTDPVIEIYYDSNVQATRVRRHTSSSPTTYIDSGSTSQPLSDLNPIWNARDWLAGMADPVSQRNYTSTANSGRHMLTWFDADLDGVVDAGETKDFTDTNVSATNYTFFDVANQATAQKLVRYIRGQEYADLRNRTIDYYSDGAPEVMRLGDIIDSTPTVVDAPAESFDMIYADTSYTTFYNQYRDRRTVVYVGANDGALHAFNGGFYNPTNKSFDLTRTQAAHEAAPPTSHPLGTELWAYVPMNLMPHLKWLSRQDYTHVYYMDAKPRIFDAKVFTADATHPNGWGTILVAGMRLGGGEMIIDTGNTGYSSGANPQKHSCGYMNHAHPTSNCDPDDYSFRSAYVVLDITNPEQPPILLAEITGDIGLTLSYPSVAAIRTNDNATNKWYLLFGSGPTTLNDVTSGVTSRILAWDLATKTWATNFGPTSAFNTLYASSFVGDPVTADWDLDYKADTVYFGATSGTPAAPSGKLYKLSINEVADSASWTAPSILLNTAQPVQSTPSLALDEYNNRWVYAGTGRLLVAADKASTAQQTLYGIKDPEGNIMPPTANTGLPNKGNLVDVTNAVVYTDNTVDNVTGVTTLSTLEKLVNNSTTPTNSKDGWMLNLCSNASATPCQRQISQSSILGEVVFTPVYTPDSNLCTAEGFGGIYGLYYKTGTAMGTPAVFGTNAGNVNANGAEESVKYLDIGKGIASSPSLHLGAGSAGNEVNVIIQTSTGAMVEVKATTAGSVKSGETSWREVPQQ